MPMLSRPTKPTSTWAGGGPCERAVPDAQAPELSRWGIISSSNMTYLLIECLFKRGCVFGSCDPSAVCTVSVAARCSASERRPGYNAPLRHSGNAFSSLIYVYCEFSARGNLHADTQREIGRHRPQSARSF